MAKLMNLFMIMIAIELSMMLYASTTPSYNPLWQVLVSPSWNSLLILVTAGSIAVGLGWGAAVVMGSVFGLKTDFMVFAVMIPGIFTWGTLIYDFRKLLYAEFAPKFMCKAGALCIPADVIAILTGGILALWFIFGVIDWWRGRD